MTHDELVKALAESNPAAAGAQNNPIILRWNPNTSRMEPFNYTDDQAASKPQAEGGKNA